MKNIGLVIGLISTLSISAYSQDNATEEDPHVKMETLFQSNKGFGAFIGLNNKYTAINDNEALLTGAEINMVIAHSLNLGFQGFGLVNPVKSNNSYGNNSTFINMGYGGMNIEPVLFSKKVVHVSFPILLGVGGIVETTRSYLDIDQDYQDWSKADYIDNDFFFIAEPGAQIEVNMFKWMRLGVGASYRFTGDVELQNHSSSNIDGFSANLNLRLGWF